MNDKIDYDLLTLTPYEKLPYGRKIFNSSQLGQGTSSIFQNQNKWNGRLSNTINSGQNPVSTYYRINVALLHGSQSGRLYLYVCVVKVNSACW